MSASISSAVPLSSQVGGHSGVLTTEDGSLIIKPALPLELAFYESLRADSGFAPLRPFIPKFHGTVKPTGEIVERQPNEPKDGPNILDFKLGTVLYDETASPEKVARMEKTARETTSHETGLRLTGFQVYDNVTAQPVNTPKSYGKSIKAPELPEGFRRVFPLAATSAASNGLPSTTLLPILRGIREDVSEIRNVLANIHLRMVGGSLLIIYEADWMRAAQADNTPYVVKLIDFAHTKMTPGQGPDEGVLLGLDTVIRLLDGRIEEVVATIT